MLGTLASLAPALGGIGGGTKVKVNQTASSLSSIALSISNVTGGSLDGNTSAPNSSSSGATSGIDDATSPSYGSFPDTSYDTSALDLGDTTTPSLNLMNNPTLLYGGAAVIALMIIMSLTKKGGR